MNRKRWSRGKYNAEVFVQVDMRNRLNDDVLPGRLLNSEITRV